MLFFVFVVLLFVVTFGDMKIPEPMIRPTISETQSKSPRLFFSSTFSPIERYLLRFLRAVFWLKKRAIEQQRQGKRANKK